MSLSAQLNLFIGQNGAGKTSLLEAIHFLGTGHSFRMHLATPLIQHDTPSFSIVAKLQGDNRTIPLGVERHRDGQRQLRFDGESVLSWAALANQLPIRALSAMSDRFLLDGAKIRRQFLDWMVFHVEQNFFSAWQQMQRALKHRNVALKARSAKNEIQLWDEPLCMAANQVDISRQATVTLFIPYFNSIVAQLMPSFSFEVSHSRGWDSTTPLEQALSKDFQRDWQHGYTHSGPQRADLRLNVDGYPAHEVLSQGQQKLVTYALHLAQGLLFREKHGKSPLYLIDDLAAELDVDKREKVLALLETFDAQLFITGTHKEDILPFVNATQAKLFHVEQGQCSITQNSSF